MKLRSEFNSADFAVFGCSVGVCLIIGIIFAIRERKRNTTVNYFLANRNYRILPVALSLVVTYQSSLMLIGFPAESYAYGINISYSVVGILTAYTFTAIFVIPVLHPLKLTSVYGYFQLRFGNNVLRFLTVTIGIIYNIFYMAIITVGTCVAIETVLGIPFWATILAYTILTSIYTSVGGIKAVIWTDVFQFLVTESGIIAILVMSITGAGGLNNVFEYSRDRLRTDFRFDPTIRYQFWNVSFGTFSTTLHVTLSQQAMQRVFSTPTVKAARCMYFICAPIFSFFLVMAIFEGVTVFAYFYEEGCDIVGSGLVRNINTIIPLAILDLFKHHPGLAGLFTASLSSAALSSLSSCLSSLSAVTFEDIISVKFPHIQTDKATRISKFVVLVYGLITMVLAFVLSKLPGSITSTFFSYMGCIDGPMCSIFLLSIMFRRTTTKGLVAGTFCGMIISLWINIGSKFTDMPKYPVLPPGPTYKCYAYSDTVYFQTNASDIFNYTTTSSENFTHFSVSQMPVTIPVLTSLSTGENATSDLSALQRIYSTSYILFSLIGLITSFLVGIVVSMFTEAPENYDERCLFSFRRHLVGKMTEEGMRDRKEQNNALDEQEEESFM